MRGRCRSRTAAATRATPSPRSGHRSPGSSSSPRSEGHLAARPAAVRASRLIRVADGTLLGKRISVLANRGLAGIDGTISTALGIAVASQATEQERAASPARSSATSLSSTRPAASSSRPENDARACGSSSSTTGRHDLRRARGRVELASRCVRPGAVHPAERRSGGSRARLRVGPPPSGDTRRAGAGADLAGRQAGRRGDPARALSRRGSGRTVLHRSSSDAVLPGRLLRAPEPVCSLLRWRHG